MNRIEAKIFDAAWLIPLLAGFTVVQYTSGWFACAIATVILIPYLFFFGALLGSDIMMLYSDFNELIYKRKKYFDYSNDDFFAKYVHTLGKERSFYFSSIGLLIKHYFVIVLLFAAVYYLTNTLSPKCTFLQSVYFSCATMATISYGDIVPNGYGRFLVCLHIITGVIFYIAAISCISSIIVRLHEIIKPTEEIEDAKQKAYPRVQEIPRK